MPDEELLLLAHCHQQVDSSCAGLGWRVPVQGVLQRCQVKSGILCTCHLQTTRPLSPDSAKPLTSAAIHHIGQIDRLPLCSHIYVYSLKLAMLQKVCKQLPFMNI